jgi:predicted transposase/invertase (TIGR01784 family)
MTFLYFEMPKFNKKIEQCNTHFDKWLYLLKNLGKLEKRPIKLKERIFKKLFGQAEIANFNSIQLSEYDESLKIYRDIKNVIDTARKEGMTKGMAEGIARGKTRGKAEGKVEIALIMKKNRVDFEIISQSTGLSLEEINKL